MSKAQTQLLLVEAAVKHFDNPEPPEHDASPRDQLMFKYANARDAALFFDKERKRLLDELMEPNEAEIEEAVQVTVDTCEGQKGVLLESGEMYNLYMNLSAPPKQFKQDFLPAAIKRHFPDATPEQVKLVINDCKKHGTPRKTIEVHAKHRID